MSLGSRVTKARKAIAALVALVLGAASFPADIAAQQTHWHGDYFPNVVLTDQNGRHVRFYDDMLRGRVVAINFIYTHCTNICPLDTAQMRRVQQILGDRVGRDVFMYSISIDQDTPQTLQRYMRTYNVGPGWTFLTASTADIALLQHKFGMNVTDPRNLTLHDTDVVMGNEVTGQWIKRSSFENPLNIAVILGDTLNNASRTVISPYGQRRSYADAGRVTDTSQGNYLFRTRCASCHTIGQGDLMGPDLSNVANRRDRAWLLNWLQNPDRMIAARDPIAVQLMARYRNLPMPNLHLSADEAGALMDYLRVQDQHGRHR